MYVLPIDLETSLHNTGETAVGDFAADPLHPANWIVWAGWTVLNDQLVQQGGTHVKHYPDKGAVSIPAPNLDKGRCIVTGHNIAFDILHLCNKNNKHWQQWVAFIHDPRARIWDTMAVEYRLLGQSVVMPDMDSCCEKRGWPTKPGRLKEYWKQGISTEDIPDEEVQPYMLHDAESTSRLFKDQWREAQSRGMMALLRTENDAVLTTTVMRYHGMYFDKVAAMRTFEDELEPKMLLLHAELSQALSDITKVPVEYVNPNSNTFLTKVLYGGEHTYVTKEPIMLVDKSTGAEFHSVFKSGKKKGQLRFRNTDNVVTLTGHVTCDYSGVGEETLLKIKAERHYSDDIAEVFDKVLELRGVNKLAKTYFFGYSKLTWGHDSCIHGNINHAVAATGRLSSSKPNLQNAGHTEIRKHFKSRYKGGELLEADLAQIEVVGQAFLTQDTQMIQDIVDGLDFHSKRAAYAAGVEYEFVLTQVAAGVKEWLKKRKTAKVFSFQRAYGAGAPTISATIGVPVADIEVLIAAEEAMYPNVTETQNQWIKEVNASVCERDGVVCGVMRSPTGAQYRFLREYDFRKKMSIKPTTVKNYPIQGIAADIMKLILGKLRKFVYDFNKEWRTGTVDKNTGELREPLLMVNTVHDSVVFDCPSWVHTPTLGEALVALFVHAREDLKTRFGIDFNVPISADAESGENWLKYDEDNNTTGMRKCA